METTPTPQERKCSASALKSVVENLSGVRLIAKAAESSTTKEKNSVHDPNLFTGVTAPVEPNLFTNMTAPVPQVNLDNESLTHNNGETVGMKKREDHVSHHSNGLPAKSFHTVRKEDGEDVLKLGLSQKPALKEVARYDETIVEENECTVGQVQNVDTEAIRVDQNELSVTEGNTEADNNDTSHVEEGGGFVGQQQNIDAETMKTDTDVSSNNEGNGVVEKNDAALGKREELVVQEQNTDTSDSIGTVGTERNTKTNTYDTTIIEDSEVMEGHQQILGVGNMNIDPILTPLTGGNAEADNNGQVQNADTEAIRLDQNELSVTGGNTEADNNDIALDKERNSVVDNKDAALAKREGLVAQEQNVDSEVIKIDSSGTIDSERITKIHNNDTATTQESNGVVGQELNIDAKTTEIDANVTSAIDGISELNNNDAALGKHEELVVREQTLDTEVMKITASDSIGTERNTKTNNNDTEIIEDSEVMAGQQQILGVGIMNIDPNVTSLTGGNAEAKNNATVFVNESEKLVGEILRQNTSVEVIRVEPNQTPIVEESKGMIKQEQHVSDEAMAIYADAAPVTAEHDIMAIGRENEAIVQQHNIKTESIIVRPTDSLITEGNMTEKNNAAFVQEGKEMASQAPNVNAEVIKMALNETPLAEGDIGAENHGMLTIRNSENMIGQQQSLKAETTCNLIPSEDYDDKYPAEVDMLPPSDEPVEKPTPNDILFGRGGLTNHHPGNRRFRDIVVLHKDDYMKAIKIVKPRVARKIVRAIRTGTPPGRFLKKSSVDHKWYDVGDRNAAEKASQALREKSQNEKKETKAKAKARYKKSEDMKTYGLLSYGNIPVSNGATMYGKGGTMMPPFPLYPAMYGIIPPPGVQMPLLPAMSPFMPTGMAGDSSQLAQFRGDGHNSSMKNTYLKSGEPMDKSSSKIAPDDKDKDENDGTSPTKSQMSTSDVAISGNITSIESDQSNDDKPLTYPTKGGIFGATYPDGDIMVTDQDILCGRGGATNHHKGNKRFRDIVGVHRPDYVRAPKVQKPGVARLIVKAIRSGNPPGRFLKKCPDGKWFDIGDKRAAEKASQALREKPPDERKPLGHANGDYFTFLAQQSAYGMHAGALQGHAYVYPAYPGTIVPQQHINPTLQGSMQPLFMNHSPSKSIIVPNPSNGGMQIQRERLSLEEGSTIKRCANNMDVDVERQSDEDNTSAGNSCCPSSPKRRKIDICLGTEVPEVCPGTEV